MGQGKAKADFLRVVRDAEFPADGDEPGAVVVAVLDIAFHNLQPVDLRRLLGTDCREVPAFFRNHFCRGRRVGKRSGGVAAPRDKIRALGQRLMVGVDRGYFVKIRPDGNGQAMVDAQRGGGNDGKAVF